MIAPVQYNTVQLAQCVEDRESNDIACLYVHCGHEQCWLPCCAQTESLCDAGEKRERETWAEWREIEELRYREWDVNCDVRCVLHTKSVECVPLCCCC